jgi:hypothetical protein
MIHKSLLLILILSVFSLPLKAQVLELKKDSRSILIHKMEQWKLGKDLFGMPFLYFAPNENGQRSNISFTDTGAEVKLDIKSLASSQSDYQKARKLWAQTVGAKALAFLPYEVKVNQNGHKIHQVGFSYSHENKTYHEKSYYIECRGRIIFSKSLRLHENEKHERDFKKLIETLDCAGV